MTIINSPIFFTHHLITLPSCIPSLVYLNFLLKIPLLSLCTAFFISVYPSLSSIPRDIHLLGNATQRKHSFVWHCLQWLAPYGLTPSFILFAQGNGGHIRLQVNGGLNFSLLVSRRYELTGSTSNNSKCCVIRRCIIVTKCVLQLNPTILACGGGLHGINGAFDPV